MILEDKKKFRNVMGPKEYASAIAEKQKILHDEINWITGWIATSFDPVNIFYQNLFPRHLKVWAHEKLMQSIMSHQQQGMFEKRPRNSKISITRQMVNSAIPFEVRFHCSCS